MLNERKDDGVTIRVKTYSYRMVWGSLGLLISGLMVIPGVEATVSEFPHRQTDSIDNRVLVVQSPGNHEGLRDPFRRINKPRSLSSSSKHSRPQSQKTLPIQQAKDPEFTLLGIIHGPFGRQAVIQISSGRRMFARPGLELARSGWFIKTIMKEEVLLEHFSSISARASLPQPETFILSFPTLGKSQ